MTKTKIEWTARPGTVGRTWNPVTGCSHVSAGCEHCYAEAISTRFDWTQYPWTAGNAHRNVRVHWLRMGWPYHWQKPSTIFVCSMSDLFHELVSHAFIDGIMQVIRNTPRHTYLLLTKRPQRALDYFSEWMSIYSLGPSLPDNLWFGVTCEDQKTLDARWEIAASIPAAVRYISAEPLLEGFKGFPWEVHWDATKAGYPISPQWIIVGGESGPGARRFDEQWAKDILALRGSPTRPMVFMKQFGSVWAREHGLRGKGDDPATWPEWARIREWPK